MNNDLKKLIEEINNGEEINGLVELENKSAKNRREIIGRIILVIVIAVCVIAIALDVAKKSVVNDSVKTTFDEIDATEITEYIVESTYESVEENEMSIPEENVSKTETPSEEDVEVVEEEPLKTTSAESAILTNSLYVDIIKADDDIEWDTIKVAEKCLDYIPKSVIDSMIGNGWKIRLTNSLPTVADVTVEYAGITISEDKTIYIKGNPVSVQNGLIHEVGHFVDAINGFLTLDDEFKLLYDEEKRSFKYTNSTDDGYEISNSTEYFACVFDEICINKENALENVPQTANTIISLIEN